MQTRQDFHRFSVGQAGGHLHGIDWLPGFLVQSGVDHGFPSVLGQSRGGQSQHVHLLVQGDHCGGAHAGEHFPLPVKGDFHVKLAAAAISAAGFRHLGDLTFEDFLRQGVHGDLGEHPGLHVGNVGFIHGDCQRHGVLRGDGHEHIPHKVI